MNQIATTIEQSKKLLELGIEPETADMYWDVNDTRGRSYTLHVGKNIAIKRNMFSFREGMVVPSWSISALLELMPGHSNIYKGDEKDDYKYVCAPISRVKEHYGDTPTEAAYNMIIWLIEQGYIKTEKK